MGRVGVDLFCFVLCCVVFSTRKQIMSTGRGEKRKLKMLKLDRKEIIKREKLSF